MFQSHRFTHVATPSTRDRLAAAHENRRPISRGETHRGAVVAVQEGLSALNAGYLTGNDVDGYFGPRTFAAVDAFQREYGLVADGIVGHQTLSQLDALFAGTLVRPPVGIGIHIGVDRVDPAHYGSDLALPSCANDARAMAQISQQLGYDACVLVDAEATTSALYGLLSDASHNLQAGDALLLTFSGHGSQIDNESGDVEQDLLDETTCFYDRMLVDDELYALLRGLGEGVRAHVVFDSCHSGTATKELVAEVAADHAQEVRSALALTTPGTGRTAGSLSDQDVTPISSSSLAAALEGEAPEPAAAPVGEAGRDEEVADLFGGLLAESRAGQGKLIEGGQVYSTHKQLYDAVRSAACTVPDDQPVSCTVTALSACADHQVTPAGNPLSAFTYNLSAIWSGGSFAGSYDDLARALRARAIPTATPQLNSYGSRGAAARVVERPFAF
ncbi:caspase family protein [Auraticoccus monumenti]|uniref:Putative peptidoglycan binding domain-containing protein n=1 Tax=Auraticoccus monumenti TaxID=675864 RepID=A0A1G6TLJ3_9ACTN|nr:caspase family protein [Auraticoccus monumenti]SDD29195.1 Putative peptidoglycan binding domain-containing protein [Auraticoccus monumenti]